MSISTEQLREGIYYDEDRQAHTYQVRIRAIVETDEDGKRTCLARDFFNEELENESLPLLSKLLDYTAINGPKWIPKKFKKVEGTDDLHEFKTFQMRLFCFFDGGDLIICTHGTVKKKDKAEPSDIKTALNWQSAYFKAKNNHTLHHET